MKILIIAYFAILVLASLIAIALYGKDKKIAGGGSQRIRESTLLGIAAFGGAIGAFFARLMFRHKTQKLYFSIVIITSLVLQLAVGVLLIVLGGIA